MQLKTKQCFNAIIQWDIFKRISESIWNSLSVGQQRALTKLMNQA
jgi:hypothetical protein